MRFKKIALAGVTGVLAITLWAGVGYAAAAPNSSISSSAANSVVQNSGAKEMSGKHRDCGVMFAGILGMDANTLSQELKSGKTLAQIAAAQGMDVNTLKEKLQAAFNERIDKAVANGKLTADKAAAMKANTAARTTDIINKSWTGHIGGPGVFKNVRMQIPALLGNIDPAQLKAQLKNGKSLAQIAQERGIAKDKLVSDLQSLMKSNLDQAVKDNKITADKATQIENKLPQMIERMITRVDND